MSWLKHRPGITLQGLRSQICNNVAAMALAGRGGSSPSSLRFASLAVHTQGMHRLPRHPGHPLQVASGLPSTEGCSAACKPTDSQSPDSDAKTSRSGANVGAGELSQWHASH